MPIRAAAVMTLGCQEQRGNGVMLLQSHKAVGRVNKISVDFNLINVPSP